MGMLQDDGAPIVQLLLTVSFSNPLPQLTLLDFADIARLFEAEMPVFSQVMRAGPMPADAPMEAVDIQQMMGLPRIQLATPDQRDQLLFQPDRLSFGWMRTTPLGEPHDYPGFAETLERFRGYLAVLGTWASARQHDIVPAVGEVVYTDAFPIDDPWDLASIFTQLNPSSSHPVSQMNYSWREPWPTAKAGHISGTFAAPVLSPDGIRTATFETTIRFAIESGWDTFDADFNEAHGVAGRVFKGLVNPNARAKLAS